MATIRRHPYWAPEIFWVYLHDDRSSGNMSPPAVAFRFSADRSGSNPAEHLAAYRGYLQADETAGYNGAYRDPKTKAPRTISEVGCWNHSRRKSTDILEKSPSPIAAEAVVRIGELLAIERDIKGAPLDVRQRVRQAAGKKADHDKVRIRVRGVLEGHGA